MKIAVVDGVRGQEDVRPCDRLARLVARAARRRELALEALEASAPRYAIVAQNAGEPFDPDAYEIVEEVPGAGGTDFGVPSVVADAGPAADRPGRREPPRSASSRPPWVTLDHVTAAAPAELRKGPRGGGRDRDKMVAHVIEAEGAYAREMGLTLTRQPDPTGSGCRRPHAKPRCSTSCASRPTARPSRAAGGRLAMRQAGIAWHALDHAWEMEDRSEPA